jgi:hypothetical protein
LLTRRQPTAARGSSPRTKPIARTGTDSTLNRNATLITSATLTAPAPRRTPPTTSTASVPRLGRASSSGSNMPRTRPTRIIASRNSVARAANRSVSCDSRPMVFTTSAPSKLSWAAAESLARNCWAWLIRGDIERAYQKLARNRPGKIARLTSASAQSRTNSDTTAAISMTTVPTANGSGAIG